MNHATENTKTSKPLPFAVPLLCRAHHRQQLQHNFKTEYQPTHFVLSAAHRTLNRATN